MTAGDLLSAHFALRAVRLDEDAFYKAYERPALAPPVRQGVLTRAASLAIRRVTVLFATVFRTT